jgi:UDP-N-acetylmuramoyl-L-alanyl-D-glutamate--2,6-diaminopimelate ligase
MKLENILIGITPDKISGDSDLEISSLEYDSRKVKSGALFFALRGEVTDGHNYIKKAYELGAKAIICEDDSLSAELKGLCFVKVENSRMTMALASQNFYGNPASTLDMIGITGTNGKTTCAFLTRNIFEALAVKSGLIGTTGIYIGEEELPATHTTPESLELAKILNDFVSKGALKVAMEASSHALCQHRVGGINYSAALFTNLTHEHLDYHKTMQEYAKAKKILFDSLSKDSMAIAMDSDYTKFLFSDCKADRKYIIGRTANSSADIIISDYKLSFDKSEFTLEFKNDLAKHGEIKLETKLIGEFNIENAALVCSYFICSEIVSPSELQRILPTISGAPGRMDRIALNSGAAAIVDYAHTPDALEKALETCKDLLAQSQSGGRLISVFGCGGDRDTSKRPEMGDISTNIADYTYITSDNPRTENPDLIIEQIKGGARLKNINKFEIISDRESAIKKAVESSSKGDLILIAGKGHENYQIIRKEKIHFDDKEIVAKYNLVKQ